MPVTIIENMHKTKTHLIRVFVKERNASYLALSIYLRKKLENSFSSLAEGKFKTRYVHYNDGYLFEFVLDQYYQKGMTFLFKNPYQLGYEKLKETLSLKIDDDALLLETKNEMLSNCDEALLDLISLPYATPVFDKDEIESLNLSLLQDALSSLSSSKKDEIFVSESEKKDGFSYREAEKLDSSILNPEVKENGAVYSFVFPKLTSSEERRSVASILFSYHRKIQESLKKRYAIDVKAMIQFSSVHSAALVFLSKKDLRIANELLSILPSLQDNDFEFASKNDTKNMLEKGTLFDSYLSSLLIDYDLGLLPLEKKDGFLDPVLLDKKEDSLTFDSWKKEKDEVKLESFHLYDKGDEQ